MKQQKQRNRPAQQRQGDVWVETAKRLPRDARPLPRGPLALGEATGHHHSITVGEYQRYESPAEVGVQFVDVTSEYAILTHQEHRPQVLLRGLYRVEIQKEFVEGRFENVLD